MALNVGVNVLEVDGRAPPTLQEAPTSVAAFVGRAERGLPNEPERLTNPQQFRDRFGGHLAGGYLAFAVEGFFLNGGSTAFVCRAVGAGASASTATVSNRQAAPGPALGIAAGYRGRPDPGPWGDRLRIDIQDDPRARTRLAAGQPMLANASSAVLESLSGIGVGSVVRIADGTNTAYRKVTAVEPATRTIRWATAVPDAYADGNTQITTAEFRLRVRYRSATAGEFDVVEEWPNLSMEADSADYAIDRLNHEFTGSRFITLTDLSGSAPSGLENPASRSDLPLGGGTEAAPTADDYVGDPALKTGLSALDTKAAQLVAVPDAHTLDPAGRKRVVRAALDYCEGRGDCMFVGSAPDRGRTSGVAVARAPRDYSQAERDYVESIKTFSGDFQAKKVYGALYTPWIQVADPVGAGPSPTRFVPPEGHVMGVYARTEREDERRLAKAPAGTAALVRGALGVSATFTDAEATDLTRNALVNGIRPTPGAGIVVSTSRTLSTDPRWWFVNVRLLFNFVKSTLRDGLRFVRQEPHTEELRRMVRLNVVTPFLMGLWRRGAFGSDPPGQTFTVKCDAENNPPAEVDLGFFKIEVYFYPSRPVETIVIVVGQQPAGGSTGES